MKKLEATIAKADRKTSLAAARKAGHLYYWKNGKKMAAVSAEDLSKTGLSLRDFMNKQLGLTRKDKVKHPPPKQKPRRKPAEITLSEDAIRKGRETIRDWATMTKAQRIAAYKKGIAAVTKYSTKK